MFIERIIIKYTYMKQTSSYNSIWGCFSLIGGEIYIQYTLCLFLSGNKVPQRYPYLSCYSWPNNKNYHYMRKVGELDESSISKFALTERKGARTPIPESMFDRDYQLERQYLDKLRAQRLKTEKLFEEYTTATRDLKREREVSAGLRQQLDNLETKVAESEAARTQVKTLQVECQQQRTEIKALLSDKGILIKKCKEQETQLTSFLALRAQQEQFRRQVQQLQEEVEEARLELKTARKQHQQEAQALKERLQEAEKTANEAIRQLKKERQAREALKTRSQQDKDRWQQIMMEKTAAFQNLVDNYELQLQIKEQTTVKMTSELQESVKYWSGKFQEVSKEARQQKKASEEHREAIRRAREELQAMRVRLQEKERKHCKFDRELELLQKDLAESCKGLREKEEELVRIQKSLESSAASGERQAGRLRALEQQNRQLREWVQEYEGALEQRRRRELEHKELLEDELEEITRFEKIFRSIQE